MGCTLKTFDFEVKTVLFLYKMILCNILPVHIGMASLISFEWKISVWLACTVIVRIVNIISLL